MQSNLLSFRLLAFQLDPGCLLKLGIQGAAVRKFGIVNHAVGGNTQNRRLLDHLANRRRALDDRGYRFFILGLDLADLSRVKTPDT